MNERPIHNGIDVEQIMSEIREQIRRENTELQMPAFEDIPVSGIMVRQMPADEPNWAELEESLAFINSNYDIPYYWEFGGNTIKKFLKRVVRKLLKCLVPPILAKQNAMNSHIVRCLNAVRCYIDEDRRKAEIKDKEIAQLKTEVAALRAVLPRLQSENEFLNEKLRQSEKEISKLSRDIHLLTGQSDVSDYAIVEKK